MDALMAELDKPVRAITRVPTADGWRHGVAFVVTLRDIPAEGAVDETRRLAARADLKADFQIPAGEYMVPIGRGANGDVWMPLQRLLHVMVVGESGSGKSNWLQAALVALTRACGPDKLRIALISPKRAEFAAWLGDAHVWNREGIAATADEADRLILALRAEFDRRDVLFAQAGVRNLDDYNERFSPKLPRILVVADEMLDLVLSAGPRCKMMNHLASLVSVGRSHGFHLFMGSTKPRFDVLPTTLTDNVDNRICFRVVKAEAARMVGCPGAESISANAPGRAIARIGGRLMHVQAFYVYDGMLAGHNTEHNTDSHGLGEDEAELVRYAVEELRGEFVVGKLWGAFREKGWTHHRVDKLALGLERRGLLRPAESRTAGRMVTVELAELVNVHMAVYSENTTEYDHLFQPGASV